jgi:hypothetical protein
MTGTWATGWATGDIVTAAEFKKTAGSIFDSTLGASAASVDVTGISATYAHLMVSIYARSDVAAGVSNVLMRFNGDSAANYDYQDLRGNAATSSASEAFAGTSLIAGLSPANTAGANLFSSIEVFVPNYAGSTNNKQFVSISASKSGTTTGNLFVDIFGGGWRSNAAINQVTLLPASGNFVAGTRVTIHALGA